MILLCAQCTYSYCYGLHIHKNILLFFFKVREKDYAFFWDTTVNKYMTIKDCDMMEIGPPFDPKGFGIGVPPGATYKDELSMAILKLSDQGKLHELETT